MSCKLYEPVLSQTGPPIPLAMFVKLQPELPPLWLPCILEDCLPDACETSSDSSKSKLIVSFV